jgi:hypothetical protein
VAEEETKPIEAEEEEEEKEEGEKEGETDAVEEMQEESEDGEEEDVEPEYEGPPGPRYKTLIEVKIGKDTFSNVNGDFLDYPTCKIVLSTWLFSNAQFVLNDPDGEIFEKIDDSSEVVISLGFAGAEKKKKLTGKIYSIGRILPIGTVVSIADATATMNRPTTSVNSDSDGTAPSPEDTPEPWDDVVYTTGSLLFKKFKEMADKHKEEGGSLPVVNEDGEEGQKEEKSFDDIVKTSEKVSAQMLEEGTAPNRTTARMAALFKGVGGQLKAKDRTIANPSKGGEVLAMASSMNAAIVESIMKGNVIVTEGNQVKEVSAGKEEKSKITIDVANHTFYGNPQIIKKGPVQLARAFVNVSSPDAINKTVHSATVGTKPSVIDASGPVNVPEWGEINLEDPIVEGSQYTWSDATAGGARVPESKSVMEGIARVCKWLDKWTNEENGGEKFLITSWYREPAYNMQVASSGANGPHTTGNAVDFWFENYLDLCDKLDPEWDGGLAWSLNSEFMHVDLGAHGRWSYDH